MFQTEINHFLQSFESPALTAFMQFITALGYLEFFLLFLLIFLMGINYKKGFILFMVLLWTAVVTMLAKNYFALPRPFHVDNTVQLLDGQLPDESTVTFSERDAEGFWEGLPTEVIEATRKSEHLEYGFPSGHTSIAIAFWGALFYLYRKKWIRGICMALMVLIPFSRLYLGVHFLADVLGGLVLGGLMLAISYYFILRPQRLQPFMNKSHLPLAVNSTAAFLILDPLFCFPLLTPRLYILPAFMLGFGIGFLLVARKGFPSPNSSLMHRIGRIAIGTLLFMGTGFLFKTLAATLGMEGNIWIEVLQNLLSAFVLVWGGVEIASKLGWWEREVRMEGAKV